MEKQFYNRFNKYDQNDLFRIITSSEEYTPDAIKTALKIVNEKGWLNDLNIKIESVKAQHKIDEELEDIKIVENYEYYKGVVEFKERNNSFQIELTDVPRFEGELNEQQILFFREDGNLGFDLKYHSFVNYYFKDEDVDKVSAIQKKYKISSYAHHDSGLAMGFYLLIFVFIGMVLIIIASIIFDSHE